MISCSADKSGQIFTISYRLRVTVREMEESLGKIRERLSRLKPGFVLLGDLTDLDEMEEGCARALGEMME